MAKAPNFVDFESFKAWLNSFDDETTLAYAKVLSGRVALRVVPFLAEIWSAAVVHKIKSELTLHSMRANLLSAVARRYPTADNRDAAVSAYSAAGSANSAALSAYSAAGSANSAANSAAYSAAGSANSAAVSAANSAAVSAYSAAGSANSAAGSANSAAIWKSVRDDAQLLLDGMGVEALENLPIWPSGAPKWYDEVLRGFSLILNKDGEHWDFWLDWYYAKVSGRPMDRLGVKGEDHIGQKLAEQTKLDENRADGQNGFWDRGAEAVSADIEAWIDEWEVEQKPIASADAEDLLEQGSGPIFAGLDGKLAALPQLPSTEEQHSVEQQKLFERLRKLLDRFKSRIGNALAQHPELCDAFDDFDDVFDVADLSQVDVYDLWMMGAGLIEQLRPFANFDPEKSLTVPLEPGTQGSLAEIVRLHGAFVMGFEVGRALAERSSVPLLSVAEFRALLDHERVVIRWLLESDQFELTDDARKLFEHLDSALAKTNVDVDNLALKAYPAIRNLLIFAVRSLEKAENTAGRVSLWTGLPIHAYVIGTAAFLSDNFGPIFAIAQNTPELRAYIEYHLNRLEIEFTEDEIKSKIIDHEQDREEE